MAEKIDQLYPAFHQFISQYVQASFKECDVHFTTEDIFQQLQEILPSEDYKASDVYDLLIEHKFTCEDIASGRVEWTFKRRALVR
jgi:hypothetical protein